MELLRNRGLHGRGLIEINTPEMVGRYNSALEMMGLTATSLTRFSVDMLGWSPEIADEKDNTYYLTHSFANPTAIIVTINQRHAPIYFPYHSFDWHMISGLYEKYAAQIMDVNTTDALCIDLDNGISQYSSIDDLLLVDSFVMKAETPSGLIENARRQKDLVDGFLESDTLWEDWEEREKLYRSGERYGDLRHRNVLIDELVYPHVDYYYTEALGGVYVFNGRGGRGRKAPFVIYRDRETIGTGDPRPGELRLTPLRDPALMATLMQEEYVEVDLLEYRERPELLEQKRDAMLANIICRVRDNYLGWSEMMKKKFIVEHTRTIPELYFEMEKLQKRLAGGEHVFSFSLSQELLACLARPHKRIPDRYRPVIHRLLSEMDPGDPIRLFKYNKNLFYREYEQYSECKKNWIVDYLNRRL